jgi:hypothetical protein
MSSQSCLNAGLQRSSSGWVAEVLTGGAQRAEGGEGGCSSGHGRAERKVGEGRRERRGEEGGFCRCRSLCSTGAAALTGLRRALVRGDARCAVEDRQLVFVHYSGSDQYSGAVTFLQSSGAAPKQD